MAIFQNPEKIKPTDIWGGRWEILELLGEGGQGKVWKVKDVVTTDSKESIKPRKNIEKLIQKIASHTQQNEDEDTLLLIKELKSCMNSETLENLGALKVLHNPEKARDPKNASERMKREIQAMSNQEHSHLLKIIDSDAEKCWYVSEFHSGPTLTLQLDRHVGNIAKTLSVFRPLVEAVSNLHEQNLVHRDIKPQNIFQDAKGNLILGDFGLVITQEGDETRLSESEENVGSWDWMPVWAQGSRLEDIKPTFDVFSLGKTLWSMLSGKNRLKLWYYNRPENDLTKQFESNPQMKLVNQLLNKCIVENEEDCILSDASQLLDEIDLLSSKVQVGAEELSRKAERICKVCGEGKYKLAASNDIPGNNSKVKNWGLGVFADATFRIYECDRCGNAQIFRYRGENIPPAWKD